MFDTHNTRKKQFRNYSILNFGQMNSNQIHISDMAHAWDLGFQHNQFVSGYKLDLLAYLPANQMMELQYE